MKRSRKPRLDLVGNKYGKLTVVSWAGNSRWNCQCDCGGISLVLTANMKRGNTTSCGCIKKTLSSRRATTHGLSNTLAYKTWLGVRRRCREKNHPSYPSYGGSGIDIYDDWYNSPVKFIEYMGQPPTDEHTLDRIDNKLGYFPGNVRWATQTEQANNKTNNVWVLYQGEKYTLSMLAKKIAEECGISKKQILSAIEREIY